MEGGEEAGRGEETRRRTPRELVLSSTCSPACRTRGLRQGLRLSGVFCFLLRDLKDN